MPLPQKKRHYTYQDYLSWPDDQRCEIIEGTIFDMTPAPGTRHQRAVRNLLTILHNASRNTPCEAFASPMDVILSDTNVVQPDVFIVCDASKITEKGIQGPPDVIFEVYSPHTGAKDKREKFYLYQKVQVKKYIQIDPFHLHAQQFLLQDNGTYNLGMVFDSQQLLPIKSLGEYELPLWEVFGLPGNEILSQ